MALLGEQEMGEMIGLHLHVVAVPGGLHARLSESRGHSTSGAQGDIKEVLERP